VFSSKQELRIYLAGVKKNVYDLTQFQIQSPSSNQLEKQEQFCQKKKKRSPFFLFVQINIYIHSRDGCLASEFLFGDRYRHLGRCGKAQPSSLGVLFALPQSLFFSSNEFRDGGGSRARSAAPTGWRCSTFRD
jgi:hypothetical protein